MFAVKTRGLTALLQKLDRHKVRVQKNIVKAKVDLATKVFMSVVEGSPQWSGNLAANWKVELGGSGAAYSPIPGYDPANWATTDAYVVGHPIAVGQAIPELQKLSGAKWDSRIAISNSTPYASEVEAGHGPNGRPIRPENYVYGQIAMVAYAMTKFGVLSNTSKTI